MNERGFYNLDFTGMIVGMVIAGLVVGFVAYPVLGWLWDVIKPLIHEVTK